MAYKLVVGWFLPGSTEFTKTKEYEPYIDIEEAYEALESLKDSVDFGEIYEMRAELVDSWQKEID